MSLKLQYLQYLQHRADKFLYRGRISSDIKKFFDDKTFYYKQLPYKVNASRDEIVKAWAEINDSFETLINTTRNNFNEEIAEERLIREARNRLRIRDLKSGVLSEVSNVYPHQPWDTYPTAFDALEERYRDSLEYAKGQLHFDLIYPPTSKEKIIHKAWELALTNLTKVKEKRLASECWAIYASNGVEGLSTKPQEKEKESTPVGRGF